MFTRSLVIDGNFKLGHLRQKRPEDDVWLADGHGMMTEEAPYLSHLEEAIEIKEVCVDGRTPFSGSNYNRKRPVAHTARELMPTLSMGVVITLAYVEQRVHVMEHLTRECMQLPEGRTVSLFTSYCVADAGASSCVAGK